jgi:AcrR family transcriptional regulator
VGRQSSPTRREQILDAAATLFAQRGFHGVSVDDLGAAAGVSGPALYRHFGAKEEILGELLVGVSRRLLDGGLERCAGAPDPAVALEALVAWHVDFALDNPDVITVQERDLASLPPDTGHAVRTLQHRYVAVWAEVIDGISGCGNDAAVAAAHAGFGLMNSTPHSARLPRAEMADVLRSMALAAIHAGARRAPAAPVAASGRR